MGTQGNIYAEAVAAEIREFAEELQAQATDREAIWVLEQVCRKAEEIESTAKDGWY